MNKYIIYAQELNTDNQTISEVNRESIEGIMKEFQFYYDGYTILNENIDENKDIWKTTITSGDGNHILEIYTKYEPYIDELEYTYISLSNL